MTRPCDPSSKVDLRVFQELPSFQTLTETQKADPEIRVFYQAAASYAHIDSKESRFGDGNGILTLVELERYLAKNLLRDPEGKPVDACRLLQEAQQFADWARAFKARLKENSPPSAFSKPEEKTPGLDLRPFLGLASVVPAFVQSEPTLRLLGEMISRKNAKGRTELIPEAMDGRLIVQEFDSLKSDAALKEKKQGATGEAFFARVNLLYDTLRFPIYLWPKDLKEKLKAAGEKEYQALSSLQNLDELHRRSELTLGLLESASRAMEDQEKIRHQGPAGDSYLARAVGYLLFRKPWNRHFQEARPKAQREERDGAVEALKKSMREGSFSRIEDALAYLRSNQGLSAIEVLEKNCDLKRWMKHASIPFNLERYRALSKDAKEFRLGKIDSLRNLELIPAPRLGKGGFFERASSLQNWSWLRTPELPLALSLQNFLATQTPNALKLFQESGTPVLLNQLSEEDQKIYQAAFQSASKGEGVDIKKVEAFLSKTPLSPEGQETLLSHLKREILVSENGKVTKGVLELPFVKRLLVQGPKVKGPVSRKDQVRLKEEKKNQERHRRLQNVFGAAMAGVEKAEKLELELGQLGFSRSETKALKDSLKKIQRVSLQGPNFLLEEPLFGKESDRAKALFYKGGRSQKETAELRRLIGQSRLKETDRMLLKLSLEPNGMETLLQEGRFGAQEERLLKVLSRESSPDFSKENLETLLKASALSEGNRALIRFSFEHRTETRLAQEAQEDFFAILGFPEKNALTGDFDPRSVGNLHNGLRNTVVRGAGLGVLAAPTLAGGGLGFTLSKVAPRWGLLGGMASGAALGYISGDRDWKSRAQYSAGGLALGGIFAFGLSALTHWKKLSPWWGALATGALGAVATAAPWGKEVRRFGREVLESPYRPWSDFSVAHMPQEAVGLYGDFALGMKGMEGILDGVKLIGALELGQRAGHVVSLSALGARRAIPVGVSAGLGAWQGYGVSDHRSTTISARDTLIGLTAGGLFAYGLYHSKLWTFTGAGGATGAYIGYNAVDPDDRDDWRKRVRYAMIGSVAGGALVHLLGRGIASYFKASDEMLIKNAAQVAKGEWISPWAQGQHAKTLEQFVYLEEAVMQKATLEILASLEGAAAAARAGDPTKYWQLIRELGPSGARLTALHQLTLAFEKLGRAGSHPHFSANVLAQAEKLGAAGNLERAQALLLKGAAELHLMEKGGLTNHRIAKLLLTGAVADKTDALFRPKTPLIPPFDVDLKGSPKAAGKGF